MVCGYLLYSLLQKLRNNFDIKVDKWSRCRLTGHLIFIIQCSTNALATVSASGMGKTTASYHLLNWPSMKKMCLYHRDSGNGLIGSGETCQYGWLGSRFVSESWCFCLVPLLLGTRHSFQSNFLRPFSCSSNKTYHELFCMFSPSQGDLRQESQATAQARGTVSPMVLAFCNQLQNQVLLGVFDTKPLLWDLYAESSDSINPWNLHLSCVMIQVCFCFMEYEYNSFNSLSLC